MLETTTTSAKAPPAVAAAGRLSREWIHWVIHLDHDAAARNLEITQSYHDLSSAVADALGRENANWCTFATWASRTAGTFIRDEEVPHVVRLVLGRLSPARVTLAHLNDVLARLHGDARFDEESVLDAIRTTIQDVAQVIAAGNLAVYSELAPLFSDVIGALGSDSSPRALDTIVHALRRGLSQKGGQSLLGSAFRTYAAARGERDPKRKAGMMLLANGQIGLHEQIRLQPFIAGSLNAPLDDAVGEALSHVGEGLPRLIAHEVHALVGHAMHPIAELAEKEWRRIATRELMTLPLPDATLVLGRDLPAPHGKPLYPAVLDPVVSAPTVELLTAYGATDPLRHGRGAHDWTLLSERMRYILELFRSRQRDRRLLEEPFRT
jgi:hypothetical protein